MADLPDFSNYSYVQMAVDPNVYLKDQSTILYFTDTFRPILANATFSGRAIIVEGKTFHVYGYLRISTDSALMIMGKTQVLRS